MRRAGFVILVCVIAGGALVLRTRRLALRPMHTDEAVHAYKLGEMIEHGQASYRYNPVEYHGPALNYFALALARAEGIRRYADLDERTLRLVPAVFGAAAVLLLLGLGDALGLAAAAVAAVLMAISTPMVFYSRYFIMEVLLVFFALAAIVGAWRYVRGGSAAWCVVAGAAVGFMHATKETWVFMPAAMAVAWLVNSLWTKWRTGRACRLGRYLWNWRLLLAGVAAVVIAGLLLSSFLTNPRGPLDSILTYVHGLRRAGGAAGQEAGNLHVHPWYFYLRRLVYYRPLGRGPVWSEGLIVALALAGTVAGFAGRGLGRADAAMVRILGVWSIVLTAIYSAIPYKTPWCILGAECGMILVAGVGAVALVRMPAGLCRLLLGRADDHTSRLFRWSAGLVFQLAVAAGLAAAAVQLGIQTWRANFKYYDSNYNPWVYAHTLRDTVRLGKRADALAEVSPDGFETLIKVFAPDPHDQWPLPWYLRRFDQGRVGYFTGIPDDADAPIIIFVVDVWPRLKHKLRDRYQFINYGLRPAIVLVMGVREDLWARYMERIRRQSRRRGTEP
ncbi:MAG: TIGR03663 family protein [Planctomycetes bacterium]|nr:TIGR03663 family protein [Planctomycetota bacterium]